MIQIYSLTDPRTGLIRYVGKTQQNIKARLRSHIYEALKEGKRNHRVNWIKSLKKDGICPIIDVLDIVNETEWIFWEKYWISQIKTWGFKLTNSTEGGDGSNHTQETIEKIRKANSGKNHYLFGKNISNETKAKISKSLEGNNRAKDFKHSTDTKNKISLGLKGRVFSNEHKNNLSKSQKGDPNKVKLIKIYDENKKLIATLSTKEACKFSGLKLCQLKELIISGEKTKKKKFSFSY